MQTRSFKNLEMNKWLIFYLFIITSAVLGFYEVIGETEKSQKKIIAHISDDLIPDIKISIQIRDELIDIRKSLHGIHVLKGNSEASQLELSRIRSYDKAIQLNLNAFRQSDRLQNEIVRLNKAYQLLHLRLINLSEVQISSIDEKRLALIEAALLNTLQFNERLIKEYQALIHQNEKALTEQSNASNDLFIGSLFLWGIIVCIGHQFYRKMVQTLGAPPKHFISDISQLLSAMPLGQEHSKDSLIGQIELLLSSDALTGLPNILGIKKWLKRHQFASSNITVFLMHIDGLNLLKDHYQDSYKDEIQQLVKHVTNLLPTGSCLGSVDSETFVILCVSLGEGEICRFGEVLQKSIRHHNLSLGKLSMMKISIGIAHSDIPDRDLDPLLENASFALAQAKGKKGNYYVLFNAELITQQKQRLELLGDLKKALQESEFSLNFQPQVDSHSQAIVGLEALIRWHHPLKGAISPGVFIPLAEESGLIVEIGNWVLEQAICISSRLNSQRRLPLPVSINVSSHQFLTEGFTTKIEQLLSSYQCEPAWVKLEITESIMLNASSELRRTMMEIAQTGVSICLDDFGTGYSSLSYLTQYPISQIKIDRGFMADIAILFDNRELVRSIVRIAEIFKFEIVAEGVETEEQLAFLGETSCRIIQGFLYYKPLPFDDLVKVLGQEAATSTAVKIYI
jgi:EAL domain-containing protein (putative c-di-GMP-specific phosphodiesterase class I)/GGDEF domain-containing protein